MHTVDMFEVAQGTVSSWPHRVVLLAGLQGVRWKAVSWADFKGRTS